MRIKSLISDRIKIGNARDSDKHTNSMRAKKMTTHLNKDTNEHSDINSPYTPQPLCHKHKKYASTKNICHESTILYHQCFQTNPKK